ncbi:MAG: phospholipid carrier-dependent glycosyltransferase [Symploca sp. SIO2E9]|nr:phospholipid carrier-dependent glycosyltransferase [Symploca sp. SIO2E9]
MKSFPLLSGIFLVSLALRVLAITLPLNLDEVPWMSRGSDFFREILDGDFHKTYNRHHPGVTNMWLIGSSMFLNCRLDRLLPNWLDLDPDISLRECLKTNFFPINSFIAPRLLQAVITSACMVAIYLLTKRLLGRTIALGAISLLLLEPFFLAYQRFITPDALQTNFEVLALLMLLLYLRRDGNRLWLFGSGVFMGLATASKIPALFALPSIGVWIILIELGYWQSSFPRRGWLRQLVDLSLWSATIAVVILVIWPILWVEPIETLDKLYQGLLAESQRGFFFFLGQITDSPGLLFYPLVLAYRLSPIVQLGLLACLSTLLIPKLRRRLSKAPELIALVLIPVCMIGVLSLIDSKIDRYIIPLMPVLAILAAVGWREIWTWIKPRWEGLGWRWLEVKLLSRKLRPGIKMAITLALAQLFILLPHYPYYLTYYNPLLGGIKVAQHLFMVGQGEGLDQAAQWFNQSYNERQVSEVTVASGYQKAFYPYFQGKTLDLGTRSLKLTEAGVPFWTQANHVVIYFNQFQRQLPDPKILAYFRTQKPLHTVRIKGLDYVQVYPGAVPLAEDLANIKFPRDISFGNKVRLLGYDLNQAEISSNQQLSITFYWEFLAPLPSDAKIRRGLRDGEGKLWEDSISASVLDGYLPIAQISPGTILRDVHQIAHAPELPLGKYSLEVGWNSPSLGQALEARDGVSKLPGIQAVIGEVEVVD